MKSYCATCSNPTNQKVLHEEIVSYKGYEDEAYWWETTTYQIIQCMGCDTISFRKLYNDAAMQSAFEQDTSSEELFPKRGLHSRVIKPYRNVSIDIKKVYIETIEAYNNNLFLLSGAGVRAVIEAICIDKGIKSGPVRTNEGNSRDSKGLDGKISGLAAHNYLTFENADILHEIRFLGNAAVHELATPSLDDLNIAIDILELVLDNIYEIKHKAKHLTRNRTGQG